jgi:hypothetical protein
VGNRRERTQGPNITPKARCGSRPSRSAATAATGLRLGLWAEAEGGGEGGGGGGRRWGWGWCGCPVVTWWGEVVERGMALAWPRRGERRRGEQGKRNRKGSGAGFSTRQRMCCGCCLRQRMCCGCCLRPHGLCFFSLFFIPSGVNFGGKTEFLEFVIRK